MSEHDTEAVVERVLAATILYPYEVKAVLELLRSGDRLPNGLVVVPKEVALFSRTTDAMRDALYENHYDPDEGGIQPGWELEVYRAVIAAAGEGKC